MSVHNSAQLIIRRGNTRTVLTTDPDTTEKDDLQE
jgi:hypothetical protein